MGGPGAYEDRDGDAILGAIGEARDRLSLPVEEPWSELFDLRVQDLLEAEESRLLNP